MTSYEPEFLRDLAKLLSHGPEPLEALICDLSDTDRRARMIGTLGALANLSRQAPRRKAPREVATSTNADLDQRLQLIRNQDPQRYELLQRLREQLMGRVKTLDRNSLLRVSDKLGIHVTAKMTRTAIVTQILSKLAGLERAALEGALSDVGDLDRGSSAEFLKLAAFITRT